MLKQSLEFCNFYNKIVWREGKLGIVWPMFVPIFTFILLNYKWFFEKPALEQAIIYFSGFWSFITVMVFVNGIAVRISIFRETGFLKSFTYMAGSKTPIVIGLLLNQVLLGLFGVVFFTLVTGVIFQFPVFKLLALSLITFIIVIFPMFMLMLLFPSLSLRAATVYSLTNMTIFPATIITLFRGQINNDLINLLFMLNPVEFVYQVTLILGNLFEISSTEYMDLWIVITISIIYILIGILSWKKLKMVSTILRT